MHRQERYYTKRRSEDLYRLKFTNVRRKQRSTLLVEMEVLDLVVVTSTYPSVAPSRAGSSLESPRKSTTNNCATSFMGAFIRQYTQVKYSLTAYGGAQHALQAICRLGRNRAPVRAPH